MVVVGDIDPAAMKAALILVDIQKDYFPGGRMELVGMKEASENAREMLRFFREKKFLFYKVIIL